MKNLVGTNCKKLSLDASGFYFLSGGVEIPQVELRTGRDDGGVLPFVGGDRRQRYVRYIKKNLDHYVDADGRDPYLSLR